MIICDSYTLMIEAYGFFKNEGRKQERKEGSKTLREGKGKRNRDMERESNCGHGEKARIGHDSSDLILTYKMTEQN